MSVDPKWAIEVLKRVVDDILKGTVNSRRLNRATEIEEYFASFPAELQPGPDTAAAAPKAFRDISLTDSRPKPRRKPAAKKKPVPRARKMLAPKKHPFDVSSSKKLRMLVREAGSLNTERLPLSCAFVLRAVIELAVNGYMDANSLPRGKKGSRREFDLTKKADHVVKHIVSSGAFSSSDFRAFRRTLLDKRSGCSIQALNGFVHGPYDVPAADALRAGWESTIPVLTATFGKA